MFKKTFVLMAAIVLLARAAGAAAEQYLAFQIFTASRDSAALVKNIPPAAETIAEQVDNLVRATGTVGNEHRKLGFIIGPLAFDCGDEEVRRLMRDAFAIALERNVATGFHIDDSMFWERSAFLNKPEDIEWLDWRRTPTTGRRLDWSSTPTKIMPELCLNSPAVKDAVRRRAALIGEEAARGMKMLEARGRANLFMGVIAGWETKIGRDFDTGNYPGYHALMNEGYSATNPPADINQARVAVVTEFVDLWAAALAEAGVPDEKIYSHVAFMSRTMFDASGFARPDQSRDAYLATIGFTPPKAAFGAHHRPGFSTYPQFGLLEQIQDELAANGNPPWASAEGTAADPAEAEKGSAGGSMERYLGALFGHGAVMVNIFGWGVGPPSNPFRKIAENTNAVAAYRKFLRGEELPVDPPAQVPSPQFFDKLRTLQKELPPYLAKHGAEKVARFYEEMSRDLKTQRYIDAERAVNEIFQAIKP